jgi:hypothetical protein
MGLYLLLGGRLGSGKATSESRWPFEDPFINKHNNFLRCIATLMGNH